jgi:hypothetical protein
MRKCILGMLCVVAAFMVSPMTALALDTPTLGGASATSNDSADGNGSTPAFPFGGDPTGPAPAQVSFSSQANFNGTEPRGSMKATIGANTYAGDVTCVMVNGNAAIVGGFIDHALGAETFAGAPANTFSLSMVDNGSSGDELTLDIGPFPVDAFCGEGTFFGPMMQADVKVHDG